MSTADTTIAVEPAQPRTRPVRPDEARRTRAYTLSRRAHRWALFAHIVTSVGWFGIAVVVAFLAVAAGASNDESLRSSLFRTLELLPWLSLPAGLLAVATGAVLSLGTVWGFVRHWWLVAKIAISAAVIVTDFVVVRRFAHEAVITGSSPRPLHDGSIAHVIALAVATLLSVLKPRGRTPLGRRRLG